MKNIMFQIITEYVPVLLTAVMTILVSFIRAKYNKLADDDTKKSIIADTVRYIEQIYTNIHGNDKLNKAKGKVQELLAEKGIDISDNELTTLIESAVRDMNTDTLTELIKEIKGE